MQTIYGYGANEGNGKNLTTNGEVKSVWCDEQLQNDSYRRTKLGAETLATAAESTNWRLISDEPKSV